MLKEFRNKCKHCGNYEMRNKRWSMGITCFDCRVKLQKFWNIRNKIKKLSNKQL